MAEGWPDADFCLDAPLRSPTNRNSFLGQHRTIPALRLKHRFGGSGTASALPKCSIMSGCGTRIVLRGQKPLALCDRCPCFGSLYPPLAALTFAAQSIICAFCLAASAPRLPYRHLELHGVALCTPSISAGDRLCQSPFFGKNTRARAYKSPGKTARIFCSGKRVLFRYPQGDRY